MPSLQEQAYIIQKHNHQCGILKSAYFFILPTMCFCTERTPGHLSRNSWLCFLFSFENISVKILITFFLLQLLSDPPHLSTHPTLCSHSVSKTNYTNTKANIRTKENERPVRLKIYETQEKLNKKSIGKQSCHLCWPTILEGHRACPGVWVIHLMIY